MTMNIGKQRSMTMKIERSVKMTIKMAIGGRLETMRCDEIMK